MFHLNTKLHNWTILEKLGFRIKVTLIGENFKELEFIKLKKKTNEIIQTCFKYPR